MDKLIEVLIQKKSISLTLIIGLLFPSLMLIFIWDKSGFYQLDCLKLLLLASSIASSLTIPNFFIIQIWISIYYKIMNKSLVEELGLSVSRETAEVLWGFIWTVVCTYMEIFVICCAKIFISGFSIRVLILQGLFPIYFLCCCFIGVVKLGYSIINWLKTIISKIKK